jgi:hypothetical protein
MSEKPDWAFYQYGPRTFVGDHWRFVQHLTRCKYELVEDSGLCQVWVRPRSGTIYLLRAGVAWSASDDRLWRSAVRCLKQLPYLPEPTGPLSEVAA